MVFPPDIFWITPEGKVREVVGHVTSIQARPEVYGLPDAPQGKAGIDQALGILFKEGWVRGRYHAGTFHIQMERPRALPMENAYMLVKKFQSEAEIVDVDFWDPAFARMGMQMSAVDFLALRMPHHWGLGDPSD
jgi:hypothetical protein